MTEEQRKAWQKEWEKTPAAKARRRHMWAEDFDWNVKPDGTFRIDDLEPGDYSAHFRILRTENGFGEDLVDCSTEFTVPPLPAGVNRSDEPLDLGLIKAVLIPRNRVGKPAPDFEATGLDGKKFKLSDYKGKYVLLKWWWSWCQMDVEGPAMIKAYREIENNPDWVMITLGFDDDVKTTAARVNDREIPGIHGHIAGQEKFPKGYMGSPSTVCIIGPDGKVVARNLHTVNVDREVAKVLLEGK
jgi:peroxiredoxin